MCHLGSDAISCEKQRTVPGPPRAEGRPRGREHNIPILIAQLEDTRRRGDPMSQDEITRVATKYGGLLFARGVTLGELVRIRHDLRSDLEGWPRTAA
jgi:hypothetical protein